MNTNSHGGAERGAEKHGAAPHTGNASPAHETAGAAPAAKAVNPMAFLSYLWVLIIIPFLTDAKNDPFVKFHLKQGLALIIFEVIGWIIGMFIWIVPVLGVFIIWLWWLISLILIIIGIINVLNGREKELPWIGKYGKNFSF